MTNFANHELDMMSRALERAIIRLRGEDRARITTVDLADGIVEAANEGVRCEQLLSERAITYAKRKLIHISRNDLTGLSLAYAAPVE